MKTGFSPPQLYSAFAAAAIPAPRKHLRQPLLLLVLLTGAAMAQERQQPDSAIFIPRGTAMIDELDFKNTDIKDIARILATRYQLNILVDHEVQKRLTVHLANVALADALKFMVADNDLVLHQQGNILKISNPPPPPPPPRRWQMIIEDGLLTLDVRNENLQEVLYQLARESGHTILVDPTLRGSLTGMVQALPFADGLGKLLRSNGFRLRRDGSS